MLVTRGNKRNGGASGPGEKRNISGASTALLCTHTRKIRHKISLAENTVAGHGIHNVTKQNEILWEKVTKA